MITSKKRIFGFRGKAHYIFWGKKQDERHCSTAAHLLLDFRSSFAHLAAHLDPTGSPQDVYFLPI
jgi:hypothetical protein